MATHGGAVLSGIAAGGSAAVYLAERGGHRFALKVYDPSLLRGHNASAEYRRIDLQRQLVGHGCPYLIEFGDVVASSDGCAIEMEYLPWPTLGSVLEEVPIESVQLLVQQLGEALRFLESKAIVHRDVKPQNILVSPSFDKLKLIDLGVAREADGLEDAENATDHGHRRPFIATAQYSSPEYLFRLEPPSKRMWLALTLYQVGGVIHDLVTRRALFADAVQTDNKYVLAMAVLRKPPRFDRVAPEHMSLAALAADCLVKDPDLRLRLVSWERFVSPALSGPQRLQAVAAQQTALLGARRARENLAASLLAERTKFLRDVQTQIRADLIGLMGASYTITSYTESADVVRLTLRPFQAMPIELGLVFAWDAEVEPLSATVELVGVIGMPLTRTTCGAAAVAQVHAHAGVRAVCDAALERIGAVVGHWADQTAAGRTTSREEAFDLVADAGLAQAP